MQSELFAAEPARIDPKREATPRAEFKRLMERPAPEGCAELSAEYKQWAEDEFIRASHPRRPPAT